MNKERITDFMDIYKALDKRVRELELSTNSNNISGWRAAGETWTYASADADVKTYTFTIDGDKTDKYSSGMRIRLVQTTTKYFMVSLTPTYDSGTDKTTVTIYGGADYALTSAAITSPYYSEAKAPAGFSVDPADWTLAYSFSGQIESGVTPGTWYNIGTISEYVPPGSFGIFYRANYSCLATSETASDQQIDVQIALSTSTSSPSNNALVGQTLMELSQSGGNLDTHPKRIGASVSVSVFDTNATKDLYYLIIRCDASNDYVTSLYASYIKIEFTPAFL